MTAIGLLIFVVAMSLSMLLIPLLAKLAPDIGLVDIPDARKVHEGAVPRIGGIAIFFGSIVPLLIWLPESELQVPLFCGLVVLFLFGLWDDKSNLNYRLKFAGQIIAASIVVYAGDVVINQFPYIDEYAVPLSLARIVTVICLVGVTNAVNLADGLDGLAAGTGLLAIGCLMIIAYQVDDLIVFFFSLSVVGATIGFLRFNSHPAVVFMGDSGSQYLGFCAGIIGILVSQQSNTAMSPLVPVLVLGLPILDTLFVMTKRLSEGRSPFSPDRNHIHHRFLDIGFSHHSAVIIIFLIQIFLIVSAYKMRYFSDLVITAMYLGFCLLLIAATSSKVSISRRLTSTISSVIDWTDIRRRPVFYRWLMFRVTGLMLGCIFIFSALSVEEITSGFGYAALIMLFSIAIVQLKGFSVRILIIRWCLFSLAMFSLHFIGTASVTEWIPSFLVSAYFLVMGITIALVIRFWNKNNFGFSALDLLIVVAALIVPLVIDISVIENFDKLVIVEAFILFYAIDVLFNRKERPDNIALGSSMAAFIIIIVRSVLSL
ncbi:MAG: MraY family glycosyltransferase [Sedimenticola sp.]